MSLQKDLSFGLNSEQTTKPMIEKWIGGSLNKLDDLNFFDFEVENKKILIELKTRRINHNQYRTALIGKNKIMYANDKMKEGYELYFVYNYKDGLFYVKFNENMLNYKSFYMKRRDRNNGSWVMEINVNELVEIK